MKTMLKTGYEKIMALFYTDKHAKIHLRDIARRTGLNENSASRFLVQLEEENMLRSEKDGNLKKYMIQKDSKTYSVFMFFDMARFSELTSIRRKAISYFLANLKEKPIIAFLFGSTAKNTFTRDSDIDVLLIVNKKVKVDEAQKYAEAQTAIRINCIQITYDDFRLELKLKRDNVIQSALNNGYPLTNHIQFYEECYESL